MTVGTIDSRLLRTFVAVAREGSVSRAAERLYLTQPAVSLQLKELSALTQLKLFARHSSGMTLTPDGAALLEHAQRVLDGLADFSSAAQRLSSRVRGRLRVGTILDPEFIRLGAFLRELVTMSPQIQPELRQHMSGGVLAGMLGGELDAGYYLGDAQADAEIQTQGARRSRIRLTTTVLTPFTYRIVAPPGWGRRVLAADWGTLTALPWILTPPESAHARLLAKVLDPLGLKQNGVALVDQEASMLALVRSGVGLALARDAVAIRAAQADGLVLADRVSIPAQLSFVTVDRGRSTPVTDAALAAISRAWRL